MNAGPGRLDELSPDRRRLVAALLAGASRVGPASRVAPPAAVTSVHEAALLRRPAPWCSAAQFVARVSLEPSVDEAAVAAAVRALAERHEALRTVVRDGPAGPTLDRAAAPVELRVGLAEGPVDGPFRAGEPLSRWTLVRPPVGRPVLVVACHALVADRFALHRILLPQWAERYDAGTAWAGPAPQPVDRAAEERAWLDSPDGRRARDFWATELDGAAAPVDAATAGAVAGDPVPSARLALPGLDDAIRAATVSGRRRGATPSVTLLAAWLGALARWSGRADVTVAVCAENRHSLESRELVAHLTTLLPIRVTVPDEGGFSALVDRVRAATRRAQAYGTAPVVDANRFPVLYGYFDRPAPLRVGGALCPVTEVDPGLPPGGLSLDVLDAGRDTSLVYDPAVHRRQSMVDLGQRFAAVLRDG